MPELKRKYEIPMLTKFYIKQNSFSEEDEGRAREVNGEDDSTFVYKQGSKRIT